MTRPAATARIGGGERGGVHSGTFAAERHASAHRHSGRFGYGLYAGDACWLPYRVRTHSGWRWDRRWECN
jgi:hypothetical protein